MNLTDLDSHFIIPAEGSCEPPSFSREDLVALAAGLAANGHRDDFAVALSLMGSIRETAASMYGFEPDLVDLVLFEEAGPVADYLIAVARETKNGARPRPEGGSAPRPVPMIPHRDLVAFAFELAQEQDRGLFEVALALMIGLAPPATILRMHQPDVAELYRLHFRGGDAAVLASFEIWRRLNRMATGDRRALPGDRRAVD